MNTSDNVPEILALAVCSALDAAMDLLTGQDITALPDNVQQAIAWTRIAWVAVHDLLDAMGIPDPRLDEVQPGPS